MPLRNKQVLIQEDNTTPRSSSTNGKDEEFLEAIRKKVKEEIENHEKKVGEIIKTHLENTNNQLNTISQEVFEITKSLEFVQGQLDKELTKIKNGIGKYLASIKELYEDLLDPDFVTEKLKELEDRSRRNNLRIDGVEETPNETWDVCEEKVQSIIKEELGIAGEIELDRCHLTCKFKKSQSKPRTIVCKFLRFKDKENFLKDSKKLKDTVISIFEDFYKEAVELRKSLWQEVLEHRRQGRIAYLNYRQVVCKRLWITFLFLIIISISFLFLML